MRLTKVIIIITINICFIRKQMLGKVLLQVMPFNLYTDLTRISIIVITGTFYTCIF